MRKSFDSVVMLVRSHIGGDPLPASCFLFHGRKNDQLKVLYWDSDNYALFYKRLEAGTFQLPIINRNLKSVEGFATDRPLILNRSPIQNK